MPVPNPSTGGDHWNIDFFIVDQSGIPTFVECKRFKDTRSRREVVGQMIEYAANGHYYWDRELIRDHADSTARANGGGPFARASGLQKRGALVAESMTYVVMDHPKPLVTIIWLSCKRSQCISERILTRMP